VIIHFYVVTRHYSIWTNIAKTAKQFSKAILTTFLAGNHGFGGRKQKASGFNQQS
jgi:hypothetical protein